MEKTIHFKLGKKLISNSEWENDYKDNISWYYLGKLKMPITKKDVNGRERTVNMDMIKIGTVVSEFTPYTQEFLPLTDDEAMTMHTQRQNLHHYPDII